MFQIHKQNVKFVCYLCHHTENKVLFTDRDADRIRSEPFNIVRCLSCNMVSTQPFLNDNELRPWYRSKYHGWWQAKNWHPFSLITNLFQQRRLQWVRRYAGHQARLIDFGCGDGTFIKYMAKHGFSVSGVENPDLLQQAGIQNNIIKKIIPETSDQALNHNYSKADILTFWQVLEHVADPLIVLRRANQLLKPEGMLILSVPNFKSIQSSLCRGKWFHLDIPRHRWHFDVETITALLKKSGFKVVYFSHFSSEYNPFGWLQSLLNLFLCSHNFAYNLFKRKELPLYKYGSMQKLCNILGMILFTAIFVPMVPFLSMAESALKRGGVITIAARKISESNIQ